MSKDVTTAFNWDSIPVKIGATVDGIAGAQPTVITVPAGRRWLFLGASFTFVTSAVAGNRIVNVYVRPDGANSECIVASTTAHTASLTRNYYVIVSKTYGETLSVVNYLLGLGVASGAVELMPGGNVFFDVAAIDATAGTGDNASAVSYYYKEAPV